MIDWQGLLKFTLKHTDGTKQSEFKEMSEADKKWLEQAMKHYSHSQITRIQHILQQIEQFQKLPEEQLVSALEQLQQLLDSLDKGSTLYKMGGHITLLKIIFYSPSHRSKVVALEIYSAANQNDAVVQNESIGTGALQMVELLRKESNMKIKQNLLSAVSATIRGQNLEAKRIFIRLKGMEILEQLTNNASPRLQYKINVLWRDLLFYDDRLHFTYNDLSSFSNTASLQTNKEKSNKEQHQGLTYDPNQEVRDNNQLPQNQQFKGCVHHFLQARDNLFKGYLEWLKERIKEENQSQ